MAQNLHDAWTGLGFAEHKRQMRRPVIGIIGNEQKVETRTQHVIGDRYLRAIAEVTGALPVAFAGCPEITDVAAMLEVVDGVLLPGGRANVHPSHYGEEPTPKHEPFDRRRDAVALELARACVERGVPLFGICRGLQEMNVAFGGTLHPEIRELRGRMNHRMPRLSSGEIHPDPTILFGDRHEVRLAAGGVLRELYGADVIKVNSLHGQGIHGLARRIVVEGVAEDGTIEAIRVEGAPGFALGVQWHAEYEAAKNPVNRTLFRAFGDAVRRYARNPTRTPAQELRSAN